MKDKPDEKKAIWLILNGGTSNSGNLGRLGGLAPVQVRMGKEPENPLHQISHHPIKRLSDKPVATGIIVQHYEDLVLSLTHMHKDVAEPTKQRRAL